MPAGIWNAVMSVRHFSFGRCLEVAFDEIFGGGGADLPRWEPRLHRFGFETTKLSCFIHRCTTFSEMAMHCLVIGPAACGSRSKVGNLEDRDAIPGSGHLGWITQLGNGHLTRLQSLMCSSTARILSSHEHMNYLLVVQLSVRIPHHQKSQCFFTVALLFCQLTPFIPD